jgi:hypothetical protein
MKAQPSRRPWRFWNESGHQEIGSSGHRIIGSSQKTKLETGNSKLEIGARGQFADFVVAGLSATGVRNAALASNFEFPVSNFEQASSADLRFKVRGLSSGIEPFIFKSACAHQWPGVRDRYQAKSVVPKRQAPTSHRNHRCARPAGHKAEKSVARTAAFAVRATSLYNPRGEFCSSTGHYGCVRLLRASPTVLLRDSGQSS